MVLMCLSVKLQKLYGLVSLIFLLLLPLKKESEDKPCVAHFPVDLIFHYKANITLVGVDWLQCADFSMLVILALVTIW